MRQTRCDKLKSHVCTAVPTRYPVCRVAGKMLHSPRPQRHMPVKGLQKKKKNYCRWFMCLSKLESSQENDAPSPERATHHQDSSARCDLRVNGILPSTTLGGADPSRPPLAALPLAACTRTSICNPGGFHERQRAPRQRNCWVYAVGGALDRQDADRAQRRVSRCVRRLLCFLRTALIATYVLLVNATACLVRASPLPALFFRIPV